MTSQPFFYPLWVTFHQWPNLLCLYFQLCLLCVNTSWTLHATNLSAFVDMTTGWRCFPSLHTGLVVSAGNRFLLSPVGRDLRGCLWYFEQSSDAFKCTQILCLTGCTCWSVAACLCLCSSPCWPSAHWSALHSLCPYSSPGNLHTDTPPVQRARRG